MVFYATENINKLIKGDYLRFITKYYENILLNPNKYISLVENKISEYLWWWYVKLVNSGTTALQFWLLSLWVKKWDEVILPANTYSATIISITNIWAIPVFCDINLKNYTLDLDDLSRKITNKTKVILPVHLYWYSCYMNEINSIASKNNIKVLEDASHAFWWEYKWKKLGTIWNIWIYSCHLSKIFWTLGNGGIFYTKDKTLYNNIKNYIYPDLQNKEILKSLRTPANIWAMDAITLLIKLKYIDKVIKNNIILFHNKVEKLKDFDDIISLPEIDWNECIRNFTCLVKNREKLINKWLWKVYYDIDLSKSVVFKDISKWKKLKNTEYFFKNCFSFNFYYWKK